MREPKCRAWHKAKKHMYHVTTLWLDSRTAMLQDGDTCFSASFDEIDLMEMLNVWSKDMKHVYEGDIVATGIGPDYVKGIVRIGLSEIDVECYESYKSVPYYGIYLERAVDLEDYLLGGQMYVLGNEHENPDLLTNQP